MINRGREAGRREEAAMRLGKMKRSGETYRGEKPGRVWDELEERDGGWKAVREREGSEEEEEEEAKGRRSSVVCSCLRFVSPLLKYSGEKH